jgi:hypothetical protein
MSDHADLQVGLVSLPRECNTALHVSVTSRRKARSVKAGIAGHVCLRHCRTCRYRRCGSVHEQY